MRIFGLIMAIVVSIAAQAQDWEKEFRSTYIGCKDYNACVTSHSEEDQLFPLSPETLIAHEEWYVRLLAEKQKEIADQSYEALLSIAESIPKQHAYCKAYAYRYAGVLCMRANDTINAEKYLSLSLKTQKNINTYCLRGLIYISQGKIELAKRDFEAINKIDEDNYNVYIGLGLCAQKEEKNEAALMNFYRAELEGANGDNAPYLRVYEAVSYCGMFKYDKAAERLLDAINNLKSCDYACKEFSKQPKEVIEKVIKKLNESLKENPYSYKMLYARGLLRWQIEADYQSIEDLDLAIKLREHYPEDFINGERQLPIATYLTMLYFENAIHYKVPEYCDVAVNEHDAPKSEILGIKAMSLYYRRKLQAAMDVADTLVSKYPNDYASYETRGLIVNKLGDKKQAIDDYTKAIILSKGTAKEYSRRGMLYTAIGDKERALNDFKMAIKSNPDPKNWATCYAYFQTGHKETADHMAYEIMSENAIKDGYYKAALYYFTVGDIEEAKSCIQLHYDDFYISLKYNELEDLEFLNTTEFKKFAREQLKEYNGGEEPTDQRWTDLFFEED